MTIYIVVVGPRGYREVVWGLGAGETAEEASEAAWADAREWGAEKGWSPGDCREQETTRETCQRVLEGEDDAKTLGV